MPGPAAAPAPVYGQGWTGRRPLSAGRTSATAGSSQEPGDQMQSAHTDVLYSVHFYIRAAQFKHTQGTPEFGFVTRGFHQNQVDRKETLLSLILNLNVLLYQKKSNNQSSFVDTNY